MNKKFNETIENLKAIKMTEAEKSSMLASLKAHMEYHPVRNAPIKSPYAGQVFGIRFGKFATAMAVALVVILGAGASGAAASALPGDLLYPIKVGINERIEVALARTPEAKIRAESRLLVRRIDEIKTLARENRLDDGRAVIASASLSKHSDILNTEIIKLRDSDNTALAVAVSEAAAKPFEDNMEAITEVRAKATSPETIHVAEVFAAGATRAISLRSELYTRVALSAAKTSAIQKEDQTKSPTASTSLGLTTETTVRPTQTPEVKKAPEPTAATIIIPAPEPGLFKGRVSIDTICTPVGPTHACEFDSSFYSAWQLYIYPKGSERAARQITLNNEGFFEIQLPPGSYVLYTPPIAGTITGETAVTITEGKTTEMQIHIKDAIQ